MSMRDAENEGLVFQGATADCWDNKKVENLKQRAKEIRKLGFKAKAVKSNKNEWGCGSYVLMVEPEYENYEYTLTYKWMVTERENRIQAIRDKAEKEIAELNAKTDEIKAACDKYGIKY